MNDISIYEWVPPNLKGTVSREEIDLNNIYDIVQWCTDYMLYIPEKDTSNVLIRWNIGVYQIHYALRMLETKYVPEELAESICSAMMHMIMAYETADRSKKIHYECCKKESSCRSCNITKLLSGITGVTRQFVYYQMGRKNRFDKQQLILNYVEVIVQLFCMCPTNYINIGFALAMSKLQDVELNQH